MAATRTGRNMGRPLSLLSLFGIDFRSTIRSLRGLPRFARDLRRFRRLSGGAAPTLGKLYPCLHDWVEASGCAAGAYFHQDLFVAQRVFAAKPRRHIDIGSRVDGFVAHVATCREIEVIDVRPNRSSAKGIVFHSADILDPAFDWRQVADSVSCLHALEHFGLGRYADRIDPDGHIKGFQKLAALLEPGGTLYLSVPVGPERIEFNAHRVFPITAISALLNSDFDLIDFALVDDEGELRLGLDVSSKAAQTNFGCWFGCGIFIARKQ